MKARGLAAARASRADWERDRRVYLQAAHALSHAAFVLLRRSGEAVELVLRPRGAASDDEGLLKAFEQELQTQRLRWAVQDAGLAVREHVVASAFRPELPAPAALPAEELSPEQREEIDRLIAEVEEELRKEKAPDPRGITATWEERNARPGK